MMSIEIVIYETPEGKEPFIDFLDSLKNVKDRARIETRLDRVANGNLGDFSSLGNNLYELRFFFGPGYRVYFGMQENQWVLLLCGGDKSSQRKDIQVAQQYWKSFLEEDSK